MSPKGSTVLLFHKQLTKATPTWDDQLLSPISSNTNKQVNTMPRHYPEVWGLPTSTLNQRGHVRITPLKGGR